MGLLSLLLYFRILTLARVTLSACVPEFAFYPPKYNSQSLASAFQRINSTIDDSIDQGIFRNISFSLEISSSEDTLFTLYHTAETASNGTKDVSGSTHYRIASNSKLFTALGILQQQAAGKLSLDDPVIKYVPDLPSDSRIQWTKITIRALLSHMSGLPDNYAENDVLLTLEDPTALGLPPISQDETSHFPTCEGFSGYSMACTEPELIEYLKSAEPLSTPNKLSSYSNVGFDLLGIVLSNVTGMAYQDYISAMILDPLGLKNTSFSIPDTSVSVVPDGSYFGVNLGVGDPSGGLYSTSADMTKFLQNALKTYNTITPAMNWFQPAFYGPGSRSFIGYPWEIFRSSSLLPHTTRAVTVNTKGGGLPGFYSYSIVIPDYDLVAFMVVGGDSSALVGLNIIFEAVRQNLLPAAEEVAQAELAQNYAGTYTAAAATNNTGDLLNYHPQLNSSMTVSQSNNHSLYIGTWISNSSDTLATFVKLAAQQAGQSPDSIYFQFTPTFECREGANGAHGEVWRFINVLKDDPSTNPWSDYCISLLDPLSYRQVPLNEIVFWRSEAGGKVTEIELSALRIRMGRT